MSNLDERKTEKILNYKKNAYLIILILSLLLKETIVSSLKNDFFLFPYQLHKTFE